MEIFAFQYAQNPVYKKYCTLRNCKPANVRSIEEIPFIPVSLFKSHAILCGEKSGKEVVFASSGTGKAQASRHFVKDPDLYELSFRMGFEHFYGSPEQYTLIGLLPSYLERKDSSLIYMMKRLIEDSNNALSRFIMYDLRELDPIAQQSTAMGKKLFLVGVTYALLDLAETNIILPAGAIIAETGGMKGKRKEMVREELHGILKHAFNTETIHSEYGMTELLSQAWSNGNGIFRSPPWMRVLVRDAEDPYAYAPSGRSGGINVLDLANVHSCSFIATDDLGKLHEDGSFEVLGRFDHADVRGCNLMI